LKNSLTARNIDSPFALVSSSFANSSSSAGLSPFTNRTYANNKASFPGSVDSSNCSANSVFFSSENNVSSMSRAIASILLFTVRLLKGILSMVARAGWCSTVSIISAAAGSISSSPILCALPAFAIINASLYDTSKQSCSILDEVAMIPGNVRRFGIFSCSERKPEA
ncbi:hypothetical protein M513_12852, partial [Trichuris suis]